MHLRVLAIAALLFLGFGATLPVLPGAVQDLGGGPSQLGVVLGVYPFAALAGRFVSGRATDRRGRVWTLRAGLVVTLLAGLVLVVPVGFAGLVAGRLLHGLGTALAYTAVSAWVLDRSPVERRPQQLALLGSGIWAGNAVGPLAGVALGGITGVGLLMVATVVLGWLLSVGLPEHVPGRSPDTGLRSLLPRGAGVPALSLGLGNLGYAAVVGFLVLQVDGDGGRGALALTSFSVAVLVGRLAVVPLAVRAGLLRMLPVGLVAMAGGLLSLAVTTGTAPAVAAAAVIGLGYCLPFPALASLVAGRVPDSSRGAALGALTASYDVFVGVGSLVFGLLAAQAGSRWVFVAAAGGVLAAAAVNAGLARGEARQVRVAT